MTLRSFLSDLLSRWSQLSILLVYSGLSIHTRMCFIILLSRIILRVIIPFRILIGIPHLLNRLRLPLFRCCFIQIDVLFKDETIATFWLFCAITGFQVG